MLHLHQDGLILTLGINDFDVRRILVDPGSSADVFKQIGFSPSDLENPKKILSVFNGASTTSLGDVVSPVQARAVVLNVQFSIVEDLSPLSTPSWDARGYTT